MRESADPYLIPGTGVLRNLLGLADERDLALFENESVTLRYSELTEIPLAAEGTVRQLRWIHHYLFRDVYEWAGQIRTIDMSKGGGSVFQPLQLFDIGVEYAERTLRNDHMLRGMDHDTFLDRLSVNYDDFNTLHPFREGNGRTQRVFWTLIARDAGWSLDWSRIGKHENDYASFIAHENVDYHPLTAMFDKIVRPLPQDQDHRLLPAIGFDHETRDADEQPNVYQVLSDRDYEKQRERYSYQKDDRNPGNTKKGKRDALEAMRGKIESSQSDRSVRGNPNRHKRNAR